jgi:zinc transport system substrate-binding protein
MGAILIPFGDGRRVRPIAAVALCLSLVAFACAGGDSDGDGGNGKVRVVAGFYPLAEAAARVGGDRVDVTNLTPAGSEPHDLELRSGDIDRIERAAVVLYLGGGFQAAVEEAAKRADGEAVDLLAANEEDPHVWLDPNLMVGIAERVRAALVEADAAGRATYDANAAAYTADITALDAAYRQGLTECERRVIVTSHDAFGHLARRYGLVQDAITGLSPESEPDPERLSQLASKVRAERITTIFYETLVSPEVAETLARETGARTAVLDPIEGITEEEQARGRTYELAMTENLSALRTALGCR